jgi:O-antigen/teichoic acid export membrane protein
VLRRLTGFTVLPLLSLVTPFLLLPVVARVSGPAGWSSFVAGQAIGTFGATVVFWGWNVGGPVLVAQARTAQERAEVYASSLRTRYLLLVGVVPLTAAVSALVAQPGHRVDAAAMAAATSLLGMSPSWYGIGVGDPWLLFWYDTLPRVVAAVVGAVLVAATGWIWLYPLLLAASVAVSLVAFRRRVTPEARHTSPWPVTRATGELRHHLGTAGINLAATAYASTPVPVATAAFRPEVSSPFASADAAYRFGLFSVTAMGNAFQGWTLEPDLEDRERRSRHRSALLAHLVLGVVGGALFAALGPWATGLLFGADVAAPRDVCVWYGLAFCFLSASTPPIRNLLIPAGRVRLVLGWTLGSAVVGLVLMVAAAVAGWSAGVAAAMAASEALLLAGLLLPALRASRTAARR